jgi:hypothetical protein
LRDVYIPAHNARFATAPEQPGTAFVAIPGVDLDEVLCVQQERQVGNDNCVSYNRLKLQIPESPLRPHFVKARVKVRTYPDGTHAIFHGPRCLGRYDAKGLIRDEKRAVQARSTANKTRRSGHLMCYQNRTSSLAIDSRVGIRLSKVQSHGRLSPWSGVHLENVGSFQRCEQTAQSTLREQRQ